ncbi:MAG: IS3 family transposase [Bacilli bacterium]
MDTISVSLLKTFVKKKAEKIILVNKIKKIFLDSRKAYGSPRITAALNSSAHIASQKRVKKLMKQNSIVAISYKKFKTKPKHSNDYIEQNLIKDLKVDVPNQI